MGNVMEEIVTCRYVKRIAIAKEEIVMLQNALRIATGNLIFVYRIAIAMKVAVICLFVQLGVNVMEWVVAPEQMLRLIQFLLECLLRLAFPMLLFLSLVVRLPGILLARS